MKNETIDRFQEKFKEFDYDVTHEAVLRFSLVVDGGVFTNKELAKKLQDHLNESGVKIKLSHAYEVLSRVCGYKSWNVASGIGANLQSELKRRA